MQSPDPTPRTSNDQLESNQYSCNHANFNDVAGTTNDYQCYGPTWLPRHDENSYVDYNCGHEHYENASYVNYDANDNYEGGYGMMMVPFMMPNDMMSCGGRQAQDLVKPGEQFRMPSSMSRNGIQLNPQAKPYKGVGAKPERLLAKKQDLRELNTEPVDEITTVMFRGIPCSFSQDALMKTIDHAGLKGKYDFFYLPRVGNHGSNLGYAFINFTDQAGAEQCMATFNGVPLDPSRSTKTCTISQADIQGLENLRKHFRRTAVSRGARGPVFLKVFNEEDGMFNAEDADSN